MWANFHLSADFGVRIPAIKGFFQVGLGHTSPGFAPHFGPRFDIMQLTIRIPTAARHEAWENAASGLLTDRIIAQIKAPADFVADVGKRAVQSSFSQEDYVAPLSWYGQRILPAGDLFGNFKPSWTGRTVGLQPASMAFGHNLQTAMFLRGVG